MMKRIMCDKLWLSQKEAVAYIGMSKDWLEARREDGSLHFSKVANTIFYIKSEIDSLIANGAAYGKQRFTSEIEKSRKSIAASREAR